MGASPEQTRVWPRPKHIELSGPALAIDRPLRLQTKGRADWLSAEARRAAAALNRAAGRTVAAPRTAGRGPALTVTDMDALPASAGLRAVRRPEGYVLRITRAGVVLAGADPRGVFYGARTLAQLLKPGRPPRLPGVSLRDWPSYPMRGVHAYLPPREQLDYFVRFLDFLADLKCNVLFLEIGGGMEYTRRPKINAAWRTFCRQARAYDPANDPNPDSLASPEMQYRLGLDGICRNHPVGPNALQEHRYFYKDSTHTELAGGEWLTRREVRTIAAECRKRHIEIVPEVQSLSHCYYLCCAYPEIAERDDDPWPDTYCPSHPKSYEVLFDVMGEVIEAFQPRLIHAGHDELYTLGVCPRCRKRTGHDLLAGDLERIHDFLADRGVRMAVWGDKLMNARRKAGRWGPICGLAGRRTDPTTGKVWSQPATWKAIRRIPKDILIIDWYWRICEGSERYFHEHGFEVCYGNFEPFGMPEWTGRADPAYVLGAETSSWCEVSHEAFGHNGVYHSVFATADLLWRGRPTAPRQLGPLMAERLAPMVDRLAGRARWLVGGKGGRAARVDIAAAAGPLPDTLAGRLKMPPAAGTDLGAGAFEPIVDAGGKLERAVVLDRSRPAAGPFPVGRKAKRLLLLAGTTMADVYFRPTFYSLHRGPGRLLDVRVKYADGKRRRFPAVYGEHVGPVEGLWPTSREGRCFRAVPVPCGRDLTLYAFEWPNPRPEVPIASVAARLAPDATDEGEVLIAAVTAVV